MIEKVIVLDQVDPVIFYGVNNSNILLLKTLYPKLRFAARGRAIKIIWISSSSPYILIALPLAAKRSFGYRVLSNSMLLLFTP